MYNTYAVAATMDRSLRTYFEMQYQKMTKAYSLHANAGRIRTLLACGAAGFVLGPYGWLCAAEPPAVQGAGSKITIAQADPQPTGDKPEFVLKKLDIVGVSVFREDELRPIFASDILQEISGVRLSQIAERLTQKYVSEGYILSRVVVPSQDIHEGAVRFQAIEGYVEKVEFQGASPQLQARLQTYTDRIRGCRPLRRDVLERYVLLMNELPGVSVQPYFVPSATDVQASTLVLNAQEKKLGAYLSVDNRGSRAQGREVATTALLANAVLGGGDRTILSYTRTSQRTELESVFLSHSEQIGSEGGKLLLAFNRTSSEPGGLLAPLNLVGVSRAGVVTYSYPWLRSNERNLVLRSTFSVLNAKSDVAGFPAFDDRIRALRFGGTFDLVDAFNGVNQVDVEVGQGLNIFGARRTGSPNLSTEGGQSDFTKVTFFASRLQGLIPRWTLLTAITGQAARGPLLASEQFSVGGTQFGRGYDPSELSGDAGIAGKLELRYTYSTFPAVLSAMTAYTFYDGGRVSRRNPVLAQPKSESLSSTGFGLRFSGSQYWSGFVEIAKPLTRDVAGEGDRNARLYAGFALSL